MVPPDLPGQLAQLRQADAEALEPTRPGLLFLPVRNATFVSVLFQECEHLGLCHGLPSSGWTNTTVRGQIERITYSRAPSRSKQRSPGTE